MKKDVHKKSITYVKPKLLALSSMAGSWCGSGSSAGGNCNGGGSAGKSCTGGGSPAYK